MRSKVYLSGCNVRAEGLVRVILQDVQPYTLNLKSHLVYQSANQGFKTKHTQSTRSKLIGYLIEFANLQDIYPHYDDACLFYN